MSDSELDPQVLKRSLPPEIHGVIDQVKANVDHAVAQIVGEFKDNAQKIVTDFSNQKYSDDLKAAIQKHTDAFEEDLKQMDGSLAKLRTLATNAAALANAVENAPLKTAVADLVQQANELQTKLKNFRDKTSDFGQKVGGAIATAAVKTFTSGIG